MYLGQIQVPRFLLPAGILLDHGFDDAVLSLLRVTLWRVWERQSCIYASFLQHVPELSANELLPVIGYNLLGGPVPENHVSVDTPGYGRGGCPS